jgi:hypothetical protein
VVGDRPRPCVVYAPLPDAPDKKKKSHRPSRRRIAPGRDGLGHGLRQKHGITTSPASKEASWAGVRDKMISGELDFCPRALRSGCTVCTLGQQSKSDTKRMTPEQQRPGHLTEKQKTGRQGADGASLARMIEELVQVRYYRFCIRLSHW